MLTLPTIKPCSHFATPTQLHWKYSVLRNSEDFANRISGGVGGGALFLLFYFILFSYTLFYHFAIQTIQPALTALLVQFIIFYYMTLLVPIDLRRCIFEAMSI